MQAGKWLVVYRLILVWRIIENELELCSVFPYLKHDLCNVDMLSVPVISYTPSESSKKNVSTLR